MGPYVDQSGFEISSYVCEGVHCDIVWSWDIEG